MHKDVQEKINKKRLSEIQRHNNNTNIVSPSFNIGDFVIVRRATDKGHKLQFKWTGPAVITAVHGKLVYGVTPLTNDKEERVHSARLLPYQDQLLDTTVPKNGWSSPTE